MEPGLASPSKEAGGGPSSPSSSSTGAAVSHQAPPSQRPLSSASQPRQQLSRYESQKRRDWNTFLQHLKNLKPAVSLAKCVGAHVIEFMKYLDQFGKTKVHAADCAHFGHPNPSTTCACPLKQAWGSLDALVGRLRAAYEENGGRPESNPFGTKAVRVYLREVRESQAKARGIPFEKKRKRSTSVAVASAGGDSTSVAAVTTKAAGVVSEGSSSGSSALGRKIIDRSIATSAAATGDSGGAVNPAILERSDALSGSRSDS